MNIIRETLWFHLTLSMLHRNVAVDSDGQQRKREVCILTLRR